MINIAKMLYCTEKRIAVFKFIQSIFKEYKYCKEVRKKHFNKKLIMTVEQNEEFEKTNICWVCGKLIGDN